MKVRMTLFRGGRISRHQRWAMRRIMGRVATVADLLALGLLLSACAARESGGLSRPREPITIEVRNQSFADLRVEALIGESNRVRLGRVEALNSATLRVPIALSGAAFVRLMARPLAAGAIHQTEPIRPEPGDTIVWIVGNQVQISRWYVR